MSSVEFPNASNTSFAAIEQRRTRKRITPSQLEQLEELYRQSSHPTREQRDALGKRIQMYAYIRIFLQRPLTNYVTKGNKKCYDLVSSESGLNFLVKIINTCLE